jgi:hypothetical protein
MYESSSDVWPHTLWLLDGEDNPSPDVVDNNGGYHSGMLQTEDEMMTEDPD